MFIYSHVSPLCALVNLFIFAFHVLHVLNDPLLAGAPFGSSQLVLQAQRARFNQSMYWHLHVLIIQHFRLMRYAIKDSETLATLCVSLG